MLTLRSVYFRQLETSYDQYQEVEGRSDMKSPSPGDGACGDAPKRSAKANPCTLGNSASIIIVHRLGGLEAVPRQVGLGEVSWDESSRQVRGWGRQAGVEKRSWKRLPGRESSR